VTLAIVLVDLDDTLFQTLRKRPSDVPEDALSPLAFDREGAPLSFATPSQTKFLQWLSQDALVVPVTARSREALSRVRIAYSAAICAHGGVLLDEDGSPDAAWSAEMAAAAEPVVATLRQLAEHARASARESGCTLEPRILEEDGVALYLVLKHPEADEAALSRVANAVERRTPAGWTIHRNGNNVAFLPPHLGKHHAVARLLPRLRRRCPDSPVIGVGDSTTDAAFMSLCDWAMTPRGSQLWTQHYRPLR
jgi:hypothetical protein